MKLAHHFKNFNLSKLSSKNLILKVKFEDIEVIFFQFNFKLNKIRAKTKYMIWYLTLTVAGLDSKMTKNVKRYFLLANCH